MTTKIFPDYAAFLDRPDKTVNGVTQEFADAHHDWQQERGNKACWDCSGCSHCSDCSRCSRCSDCSRCSRCEGCSDCWDCSDCSDCSGCSDCEDCSDCSGCSDCEDCSRCEGCEGCEGCEDCSRCEDCEGCSDCWDCSGCSGKNETKDKGFPAVPVIPQIHAKILEAVISKPESFEMGTWHNACGTQHCRAGHVVMLAGEAGKKLEDATSTLFAAMQIYKASSPVKVPPTRFFGDNDSALTDMRRCAAEEANLVSEMKKRKKPMKITSVSFGGKGNPPEGEPTMALITAHNNPGIPASRANAVWCKILQGALDHQHVWGEGGGNRDHWHISLEIEVSDSLAYASSLAVLETK